MEFEVARIDCIRNILSDLSTTIENALQNIPSQRTRMFIEHFTTFKNIVNNSLMKLSDQQRNEKKMLSLTADLNDAAIQLQRMRSELEEKICEHEKSTNILLAQIVTVNELLQKIKKNHDIKISEEINKTEEKIRMIETETEISSELLKANISSRKLDFESTLKTTNLQKERQFYKKRLEVEEGYLKALAKYDSEIGTLDRMKRNLTVELEDLDTNLENFKQELAVQEVRYLELKQEREMAILKAFTEDLENFTKNRAARVIQKAWRIYYERCCMRKKKKSKKKK